MIKDITNKNCFGCRSCEQVCPAKCITIVTDNEGFLVPSIDTEKCLNCGLCEKKCPQFNLPVDSNIPLKTYAAMSKEDDTLLRSSSGGIMTVIAKDILEDSGVVYGAAYNTDLKLQTKCVQEKEELDSIRRSKYVQCDTGNSYTEIKEKLDAGFRVLYTSTPCQTAGLKCIWGREYDNLLLIDIVCHGVPSPKLFSLHLKWLENKYKSKIMNYEFRKKRNLSINRYQFTLEFPNKTIVKDCYCDRYFDCFLKANDYRESCYACPYPGKKRVGDITIGDYTSGWKHHKCFTQAGILYPNLNLSFVMINSQRGRKAFERIESKLIYEETKLEWISEKNLCLVQPTARPNDRDYFYKKINSKGYEYWMKEYLHSWEYIKLLLKQIKLLFYRKIHGVR